MSQSETGLSDSTPSMVDSGRSDIEIVLHDVHERVGRAEERVATLESDLGRATDQEAAKGQEFNWERERRLALELELQAARVEEVRLLVEEASQTTHAIVAEAERQAEKIIEEADAVVEQMLADAKAKGAAIVDAERAKLDALEAEIARRAAKLDSESQQLERRLSVMQRRHDELRETLQLVADVALEQLSEAQRSVERLHSGAKSKSS